MRRAQFSQREDGNWHAEITFATRPFLHLTFQGDPADPRTGSWLRDDGTEVKDLEGFLWLNYRCFGRH